MKNRPQSIVSATTHGGSAKQVGGHRRQPIVIVGLLVFFVISGQLSEAHERGEARFFAGCANRPRLMLHKEGDAPRSQTFLYAIANLMELEVIRLADWTIDLPLPGPPLRPVEEGVKGIRIAYRWLGTSLPVARLGQLVDAFQLPELSLGDVAVVYGASTEGTLRPGSGMLVRLNKLVDWTQDLTGDLNGVAGRPVGRSQGLVRWRAPGRAVDGVQNMLTRIVHRLTVTTAWVLEKSLAAGEGGVEAMLNIGRPAPHHRTTVFLRLPSEVYRTHDAWCLAHRRTLYRGSAEELALLTHAQLFHPGVGKSRLQWWRRSLSAEASSVILVTNARTMAHAPRALRAYVVPASWVLDAVTTAVP